MNPLSFLPPPRIPHDGNKRPPAEHVSRIVGDDLAEPLRDYEAAVADAHAAVAELVACRPGGDKWKAALGAAAAAYADGKKDTTLALMMAEDDARWIAAQVRARYVPVAAQRCDDSLSRVAMLTAVAERTAEATAAYTEACALAWKNHNTKGAAWGHLAAADEAITAYTEGMALRRWLTGHDWDRNAALTGREAPRDPVAAGQYYATQWALGERNTFGVIPRGVVWPDDDAGRKLLAQTGEATVPSRAGLPSTADGRARYTGDVPKARTGPA